MSLKFMTLGQNIVLLTPTFLISKMRDYGNLRVPFYLLNVKMGKKGVVFVILPRQHSLSPMSLLLIAIRHRNISALRNVLDALKVFRGPFRVKINT